MGTWVLDLMIKSNLIYRGALKPRGCWFVHRCPFLAPWHWRQFLIFMKWILPIMTRRITFITLALGGVMDQYGVPSLPLLDTPPWVSLSGFWHCCSGGFLTFTAFTRSSSWFLSTSCAFSPAQHQRQCSYPCKCSWLSLKTGSFFSNTHWAVIILIGKVSSVNLYISHRWSKQINV